MTESKEKLIKTREELHAVKDSLQGMKEISQEILQELENREVKPE